MKSKLMFLMLGVILLIGIGSVSATTINIPSAANFSTAMKTGLLAYYSLDEAAGSWSFQDNSSNGNTLTAMISNMSGTGKVGRGVYGNGTVEGDGASMYGSYLKKSDFTRPTGNFTVAGWTNLASCGTSRPIVGMDDENGGSEQTIMLSTEGGCGPHIQLWLSNGTMMGITSTAITADNKYYYLLSTYDGTNLSLYVNGALVGSRLVSGALEAGTGLAIGASSDLKHYTGSYVLDGYMDEVGIWNRALSQSEINSLYNSGSGLSFSETGEYVEPTAYETSNYTYTLNITANATPTNAKLVYKGTSYSATVTASGSDYLISYVMSSIPSSLVGTNSFYYEWNLSSIVKENSSTYNQTVSAVQFGLCNATLTFSYLNITFKDESTDGWINATIPTSTFEYYLGDGSITKTLTYSQTVNKSNYQFCGSVNQTYKINPYIQYKLGTDYPQRIYDPDLSSYSSITSKTLYLLSSTDGIYVTFQIANQVDQLLSGVSVTSTRTIGSTLTTVASGTTGSDGTATFWLNPDFEQNFTFSKTGFTTYTILLIPTQSSYTITLSGATTVSGFDYSRGISYFIKPKDGELINNTIYNFNYTLFSTYWDVSSFGFSLKLKNGTILASASSSSNGGIVSTNFNVSNYSLIYMDYYYVINGTYSNFTTHTWHVIDQTYTGWSIKTFFEDFNLYVESVGGIFGLDEFGRYLLIFIFIFFTIGIMSYKFGITSPVVISSMLFAIVFFFDVVIGLLPTPINAIPHSLTFLSLIIVVVLLIKEGQTG